eukprot:602322_1
MKKYWCGGIPQSRKRRWYARAKPASFASQPDSRYMTGSVTLKRELLNGLQDSDSGFGDSTSEVSARQFDGESQSTSSKPMYVLPRHASERTQSFRKSMGETFMDSDQDYDPSVDEPPPPGRPHSTSSSIGGSTVKSELSSGPSELRSSSQFMIRSEFPHGIHPAHRQTSRHRQQFPAPPAEARTR